MLFCKTGRAPRWRGVLRGEPTLQSDLPECVRRVRALGYKTKLDTNGSRPEVLRALIADGLLDYVAMDYKAPLEGYSPLCNANSAGVPESLALLRGSGVPYELRTTLVPQIQRPNCAKWPQPLRRTPSWFLQLYRPQPGDEAQLRGLAPVHAGRNRSARGNAPPRAAEREGKVRGRNTAFAAIYPTFLLNN